MLRSDTTTQKATSDDLASLKPFRLVKFFSFTSLIVILACTFALSWLISNNAQQVLLERSESYAFLLAENLNNQVFVQFVLPTALRYGEIALRNPKQFKRLDTVVRNTTSGLKVDLVTIFDSKQNIISYSTDPSQVGKKDVGGDEYFRALEGESNTITTTTGSILYLLPGSDPISCKLKTFIPFRGEQPFSQESGIIMGVTEIVMDLSEDLRAIFQLQVTIIAISMLIMTALFIVLRFIVAGADKIIEARAQERKRLEDKLNHAERLASLGKMVTAVSHEIKNPLGIVRSTAEILRKRLKDITPQNARLANIIIEETTRLDGIVMEFLDFARPQIPNFINASINDTLSKVGEFIQPEIKKQDITLAMDLDPELPVHSFDPNLIYRGILNIVINGVQAMPDGGTLTISSRPVPDSNGVTVAITDTGIGMNEEKQERIFNPFYTDKIRGTGLGLAISKSIIENHQGTIQVKSVEGEGTTFIITLVGSTQQTRLPNF